MLKATQHPNTAFVSTVPATILNFRINMMIDAQHRNPHQTMLVRIFARHRHCQQTFLQILSTSVTPVNCPWSTCVASHVVYMYARPLSINIPENTF